MKLKQINKPNREMTWSDSKEMFHVKHSQLNNITLLNSIKRIAINKDIFLTKFICRIAISTGFPFVRHILYSGSANPMFHVKHF